MASTLGASPVFVWPGKCGKPHAVRSSPAQEEGGRSCTVGLGPQCGVLWTSEKERRFLSRDGDGGASHPSGARAQAPRGGDLSFSSVD